MSAVSAEGAPAPRPLTLAGRAPLRPCQLPPSAVPGGPRTWRPSWWTLTARHGPGCPAVHGGLAKQRDWVRRALASALSVCIYPLASAGGACGEVIFRVSEGGKHSNEAGGAEEAAGEMWAQSILTTASGAH